MTTPSQSGTRRNLTVAGSTAAVVGLLFLFPTSTNSGASHRKPGGTVAPAGVVTKPSGITAPAAATVVNGSSVDTRYGPVQVQITVKAGKLVSATAINYPQGSGRDQQINSYAIPVLQQEAVNAQSAKIDAVSGATYTSQGYQASLQSALDAAHLG